MLYAEFCTKDFRWSVKVMSVREILTFAELLQRMDMD